METEKTIIYVVMALSVLMILVFLLDAALGIFGRVSIVMDVLFILAGGLVLWQSLETAREMR